MKKRKPERTAANYTFRHLKSKYPNRYRTILTKLIC